MKICFVASGDFHHVIAYIDFMMERGHEVFFLTLSPRTVFSSNIKLIDCWNPGLVKLFGWQKWMYFVSGQKAKRVVKRLKPDILHAHFATSGGIASYFIDYPKTILTVHGSDIMSTYNRFPWRIMLKKVFARCIKVNSVSIGLTDKLGCFDVPKSKVSTFNMGIDYDLFCSCLTINKSMDTLTIVVNRSFKPIYNHRTILKSFEILMKRNIPFNAIFIGDGQCRMEIEQMCADCGLSNCVRFIGSIPNEAQVAYFNEANVYISASLSDGTSLSLLEALAAGLFPIVSDIEANRAWIKNFENGLLFASEKPEELANMLIYYFKNYQSFSGVKSFNQEKVAKYGDRKANMLKLEKIYESMLSQWNIEV